MEYSGQDKTEKEAMNIAYACNRHFLQHAMVSIYSLLTNGRGERSVRILLMAEPDLCRSELAPIFHMVSCFPGCTTLAVWPQERTDRRFASDGSCCLSKELVQVACYRLFIPDILKEEERCLYLDCDTVICHPLTELYDKEMGNTSIAGVTDRLCLKENQVRWMETEGGIVPGYYINSGVMLMDLDRMRTLGNAKRALELAYHKPFPYMDQDVLNRIYQGEIMLLSKQYNVFPDDDLQDMKTLRMLLPESAELFSDEALTAPAIVHYIGKNKPWIRNDVHLAQYWREAETACKDFRGNI